VTSSSLGVASLCAKFHGKLRPKAGSSKLVQGEAANGCLGQAARARVPGQGQQAVLPVLVCREEHALVSRQREHARDEAARADLVHKGQRGGSVAGVDREVGDAVRGVTREAVRDVEVLAARAGHQLARGSGGGIGGWEVSAEGREGLDLLELEVVPGVGQLERLHDRGDLAGQEIVSGLAAPRRNESTVAGAGAGLDGDAVGGVEVILAVQDEDRVGPEIVDDEKPATGIKQGLVGVWVPMSVKGADGLRCSEQGAYGRCPGVPLQDPGCHRRGSA
jgi:hypothetical protein